MKSVRNPLNEALAWLGEAPATASALSQVRGKLKHTASIALNAKVIVDTV